MQVWGRLLKQPKPYIAKKWCDYFQSYFNSFISLNMPQNSPYYKIYDPFYIAVDCVILGFHNDRICFLAHKRNIEPALGGFTLMGVFVKMDESLTQAAVRALTSLTGLQNIYMEQVGMYSEVDRDPGERVISCAFFALIDIEAHDEELLKKHNAFWIDINNADDLIFDHPQMVKDAVSILRRKASIDPIGLNFLPEKFTFTRLQVLYEAIYDRQMDKRNFRKKMMSLDFLEKTTEIDKTSSKKGAFLYQFKPNGNTSFDPKYNF